jgi:hypothetical protein
MMHEGFYKRFSDGTDFIVPGRTEDDVKVFVGKVFNAITETDAKPEPETQVAPDPETEERTRSFDVDVLDNSVERTFFKEENVSAEKACDAVGVFLSQADTIKKALVQAFDAKMGPRGDRSSEKNQFRKKIAGRGQLVSLRQAVCRPKRPTRIGHEGAATGTRSTPSAAAQFVPRVTTTSIFSSAQQQSEATSGSWSIVSPPATAEHKSTDTGVTPPTISPQTSEVPLQPEATSDSWSIVSRLSS